MTSVQTHHIKGHDYDYEHTYVDGKVVCVRCDSNSDGRTLRSRSYRAATRIENSPLNNYESQADMDSHIRKAYRMGYGIHRIQGMLEEMDLHATRRQTENYLRSIGLTLRTKRDATKSIEPLPQKDSFETSILEDRLKSNEQHTSDLKKNAIKDAKKIIRLEMALRDYRDMGRGPTAAEFERLCK